MLIRVAALCSFATVFIYHAYEKSHFKIPAEVFSVHSPAISLEKGMDSLPAAIVKLICLIELSNYGREKPVEEMYNSEFKECRMHLEISRFSSKRQSYQFTAGKSHLIQRRA